MVAELRVALQMGQNRCIGRLRALSLSMFVRVSAGVFIVALVRLYPPEHFFVCTMPASLQVAMPSQTSTVSSSCPPFSPFSSAHQACQGYRVFIWCCADAGLAISLTTSNGRSTYDPHILGLQAEGAKSPLRFDVSLFARRIGSCGYEVGKSQSSQVNILAQGSGLGSFWNEPRDDARVEVSNYPSRCISRPVPAS